VGLFEDQSDGHRWALDGRDFSLGTFEFFDPVLYLGSGYVPHVEMA